MTKPIEAKGLADISILPTAEKDVVALVLTDTSGIETRYAINPDGLGALLQQALGLASKWAEEPDLAIDTLTGPQHPLPGSGMKLLAADRIAVWPGRHATECAVHVFVGKVELTFLMPLDEVIHAAAELVKQVTDEPLH
jgi:hypothetical protein